MTKEKLIKNIFLVSVAIAIIFPLTNIYIIFPAFTKLLITNTEHEAERVGSHLASMILKHDHELTRESVSEHFSGGKSDVVLKDFHLLKLKIFSPSGQIIHSSDQSETGEMNTNHYFNEIVAGGKPYTNVVKKGTQSLEGETVTADIVETYVPVMRNGQFAGAFEIYYDITGRSQILNSLVLRSSFIPLGIMMCFLVVIIIILFKGNKALDDDKAYILPKRYLSPYYSFLLLTVSIFIAETIIMLLIAAFPSLSQWNMAILDAVLLVIIISPTIYFFLMRPLLAHIAERQKTEERIKEIAFYDEVTKLPNRNLFQDRLKKAIEHAGRYKRCMTVISLDIDNFKRINDTFEHKVGDLLLREVAERLNRCVRASDSISRPGEDSAVGTVARIGGDEFIVLLSEISSALDASRVAQRILDAISSPFQLAGHDIFITASTGIALYPQNGEDLDSLLKNADTAMHHAKDLGRNNYQFHEDAMNVLSLKRLTIENELRKAVERDEFLLYYQPQIDMVMGRVIGFEALIRWDHPVKGLIPPGEFIPVAEESGLISLIDKWVLKNVCWQLKHWEASGIDTLRVSLNLSAQQFMNRDLPDMVSRSVDMFSVDPRKLEFEITEGVLMQNAEMATGILKSLKDMGIRLAMDDFGTGYSSFSYLKRLPLDIIKIDRSFINDVPGDPDDAAIVTAIIAMAKNLRLDIVAEGVEKIEQKKFLVEHGCMTAQGYLFSVPLSAEKASLLLQENAVFWHHGHGFKAGCGSMSP
ncbi:MAG: EAL domain-containing protein [Nitrospiraceae bacterium]|nr:MAG: EAL domain-containing protein [Nitrospiraceae bacterium]